jgi:hypothetical protein
VRLGLDGLGPDDFVGFHRDWALQMDEHRLWRTLQGSETVAVAFVEGRVAGYAAAIGDVGWERGFSLLCRSDTSTATRWIWSATSRWRRSMRPLAFGR